MEYQSSGSFALAVLPITQAIVSDYGFGGESIMVVEILLYVVAAFVNFSGSRCSGSSRILIDFVSLVFLYGVMKTIIVVWMIYSGHLNESIKHIISSSFHISICTIYIIFNTTKKQTPTENLIDIEPEVI
jgi:hypothetical protein